MKLLISRTSERLIEDFAKSVGGSVDYTSLKVTIRTLHVSIIFSQPERYSSLLNCEFWFSVDVGFFYEDICAAFLSCATINTIRELPEPRDADEMERNDGYLVGVINFCKAHWAEIIEVPPHWYEKAVDISDKNTRSNFPDIADEDRRNKIGLLNFWRNQSQH
jgi:hypothetical protein